MDTFTEYIPLELLPEEYGGSGGKLADIRGKVISSNLHVINKYRNGK
jgi:hypothetical protein